MEGGLAYLPTAHFPAAMLTSATRGGDSPLLEEGKTDADGHVVDAQRDRVPLFRSVLFGNKRTYKNHPVHQTVK